MNHRTRCIFLTALCIITNMLHARSCTVTTSINPRSQGRDKSRQMVGVVDKTHLYDMESWWGMLSITPEYSQSFDSASISRALFGDSLTNNCNTGSSIKIQGTQVAGRDDAAWLADYFYLSPTFDGTISVNPQIRNFLVDFDFYLGLDECKKGMYLRIYGPIAHTNWNLNFCEQANEPTTGYDAGYFASGAIAQPLLNQTFAQYAAGKAPAINGTTFNGLRAARIDKESHKDTGFADLRLEIGRDFVQACDYHVGANIQAAFPTGTKKRACFLFDPYVGNGHHWELGGGLTAHYIFWRCESEAKHAGFYVDANITHLFNAKQQISFDLCGKPNSRYMLAQKMRKASLTDNLSGVPSEGIPLGAGVLATFQFANEYAPVANLTTAYVNVSAAIQSDIVAMFNYTSCHWSADFGYNFWNRSCQTVHANSATSCNTSSLFDATQAKTWALKGDARVYGFINTTGTPIALSATESNATIASGTNASATLPAALTGSTDFYKNNVGVDNAFFALGGAGNNPLTFNPMQGPVATNQIKTSIQPVFLSINDVALEHNARGLSHKLFAHVSYTWDRECWVPFFGIGGFAEFGVNETQDSSRCALSSSCANECIDSSLSQWGIWLKTGVSFD